MTSRIKLNVEGISLDLPNMDPPNERTPPDEARTPFGWQYNYFALQLMPRSLWVNGTCYGSVQPGDDVRFEGTGPLGKLFVNGHQREPETGYPFGDQAAAVGAHKEMAIGKTQGEAQPGHKAPTRPAN